MQSVLYGPQIISFYLNPTKIALEVTKDLMELTIYGLKCIHTSVTTDQIISNSTFHAELAS